MHRLLLVGVGVGYIIEMCESEIKNVKKDGKN
jgi:hypothetical protein